MVLLAQCATLPLTVSTCAACRLMPAFNTTAGTAISWWVTDKVSAAGRAFMGNSGGTNLAEAGSLSMEFSALSHLTGEGGCGEGWMERARRPGSWEKQGGQGCCRGWEGWQCVRMVCAVLAAISILSHCETLGNISGVWGGSEPSRVLLLT